MSDPMEGGFAPFPNPPSSADAATVVRRQPGASWAKKWQAYSVEYAGELIPGIKLGEQRPFWVFSSDDDPEQPIFMALHRVRVFYEKSNAYLEATWLEQEMELAIRGLQPESMPADITQVWRGVALLEEEWSRRGPGFGTRRAFDDASDYRKKLVERVIEATNKRYLQSLPAHRIAAKLGVSLSTLYAYNSQYDISMADIRAGRITRS
jgi:hypothetical protein